MDAHSKTTERIGDKNMVKESLKKILPVIQAFVEGKTIQRYDVKKDDWYDISPNANIDFCYDYRIKPELKYRPFKNQEECWEEMLKHQPFGWIKQKENDGKIVHTGYIFEVTNQVLITLSSDVGNVTTSSYLFRAYTFADGTPFGVKEE